LRREQAGAFAAGGAQVFEFAPGVKLFQDRDYTLAELVEQGFEKVALPEFTLFEAPSHPANLCTIYQKKCAAGEEIQFGMWAVPVFFGKEAVKKRGEIYHARPIHDENPD
jgi:hypothetical protein